MDFELLKGITDEDAAKQEEFEKLVEVMGQPAQMAAQQGQQTQAPQRKSPGEMYKILKPLMANPQQAASLWNNPNINQADIENVLAGVARGAGRAEGKDININAARDLIRQEIAAAQQDPNRLAQFQQKYNAMMTKYEQGLQGQQIQQDQTKAKQAGLMGLKPELAKRAMQQNQSQQAAQPNMGNNVALSTMQPSKMM